MNVFCFLKVPEMKRKSYKKKTEKSVDNFLELPEMKNEHSTKTEERW